MNCAYCNDEIYPGEECIETPDGDHLHTYCEDSFIHDNKRQLGFAKTVYEQPKKAKGE